MGTPVMAEAWAAAMSPCWSWLHMAVTPMGAMNSGE